MPAQKEKEKSPLISKSLESIESPPAPPPNTVTDSVRIICTPSYFAKSTLFYVQEIGRLKSLKAHKSSRESLQSYLYFAVLKGSGTLTYQNTTYGLTAGDYVFIDCRSPYAHESSEEDPWALAWIHFNGNHMDRYHMHFQKKSDSPRLRSADHQGYLTIHKRLMGLASNKDTDTEFLISYILHELVTKLLSDASNHTTRETREKMDSIKSYIDLYFHQKLTLDILAEQFYISKYHMSREFKRNYGISIINYVISRRITQSKELLRYSNMQIEEIARAVGIEDGNYFNKVFQKLEGMTASEYKKKWRGK